MDDGLEKDAALVGCARELLRQVGERGAMQQVTYGVWGNMQQVVRAALGVGEIEGSRPRSSYAVQLIVGDGNGALGGAPGCR